MAARPLLSPPRPRPPDVKITFIGTRGLPAAYSGFETAVENIGARLAARGHDVTVYCRPHMVDGRHEHYRGMRLVYLPTVANKYLDTLVHTFVCTLHMAALRRPDAAIYFIAGNSPLAGLSRVLGVPSVLNVDGLDSRRAKWNRHARLYLRWAERNAPRFASATVTDSRSVQRLYREEHGYETHFIPYGSDLDGSDSGEHLQRLGLRPREYVLFVGRLVPENNAHVLVEAFAGLDTQLKLVVVGDAPYAHDYQAAPAGQRQRMRAVHRVPVRRRLSRASQGRRPVRSAHRGRRHAPRDRGGHGRRQLHRGQRPSSQPGGHRRRRRALPGT